MGLQGVSFCRNEIVYDPVIQSVERCFNSAFNLFEVSNLSQIIIIRFICGEPIISGLFRTFPRKLTGRRHLLRILDDVSIYLQSIAPGRLKMLLHILLSPRQLVRKRANDIRSLFCPIMNVFGCILQRA